MESDERLPKQTQTSEETKSGEPDPVYVRLEVTGLVDWLKSLQAQGVDLKGGKLRFILPDGTVIE